MDHDDRVNRAADLKLLGALIAAAQQPNGVRGLMQLLLGQRPLHCEKIAVPVDKGQAELAQQVEPRHGAGGYHVEFLPVVAGKVLSPPGQKARLHAQRRQGFFLQPAHPFLQAVQQGQAQTRLCQLQRHAGEACPGADVQQGLSRQRQHLQKRQTVQQVQLCSLRRICDRGEIHHLVLFQNRCAKGQQRFDLLCGQCKRQPFQSGGQC